MQRTGKPLHAVITANLRERISSGALVPGDMLPSENELTKHYQTSRVTVRKSLEMLESEKLIFACQGKGYFVAEPAHEDYLFTFSDNEQASEVVYKQVGVHYPTEHVAKALDISVKQIVIEVCRVIKKRGEPVALDIKYLPYEKGIPTLESELNYAVFPEIAAVKKKPFAFHTKMEMAAELPGEGVAALLQCSPKKPVLVIYRWIIDNNGRCHGYGEKYLLEEYGRLSAQSGYEL